MENSQIMISDRFEYNYGSSYWPDFNTGNHIEWVITNGLGGYGGGSIIGAKNRTHQAYLVASMHAPVCRYATLEQITEWISIDGKEFDLETSRHRKNDKSTLKEGQKYLKRVTYDGTICFEYCICDENNNLLFSFTKTIGQKYNENTVAIAYEFNNLSDSEATLIITPLFNYREHNSLTGADELRFDYILTGDTLSLVPESNPNVRIDFSVSEGCYYELSDKIDRDCELITEVELETEGLCSHYMPYEISVTIDPKEKKNFSAICSVICDKNHSGEELLNNASDAFVGPTSAEKIISQARNRIQSLVDEDNNDIFLNRLILDADHFLVNRKSTGTRTVLAGLPWFTDWGRDTMISFTGITLCTGRYEEAKEILSTFARYVRHGIVPNMFPDDGNEPLYNTVDASLWYFFAVYKFVNYVKKDASKLGKEYSDSLLMFVKDEIFPVLWQILDAYEKGTDFSIYMMENGLLHAGSNLDQITWMDVRVGDKVVTPRHGCPVEINALWYNAQMIMVWLSDFYGDRSKKACVSHCKDIAEKVKSSFEKEFWNEKEKCLYDVVDKSNKDSSIRPNQIYAVSLPFSLLPPEKEKAIVEKVYDELYVPCGLRSLSTNHVDYHGQYRGALSKRDMAYHQGTAWGFLLGGFITAYAKVYSDEEDIYDRLMSFIKPVMNHQQNANCIGGICEIFEGDAPHSGCGCYTQAWSTGEILRAYIEDVLSKKDGI